MRKALELRRGGATYPQIAEHIGCAISSAYELVQSGLRETLQEPGDDVRQIELERLDLMLRALLPCALQQGDAAQARCAEVILKLMDRRAKYLGLDLPQRMKVEYIDDDTLTELLERLNSETENLLLSPN
jgi:hypothetical protein